MDLVELRQELSDRWKGRRRILYNDAGQRKVLYELPPTAAPERDSVLAFAMPKAGSVLLEQCMMELAPAVGLKHVSIMVHLFKLGLPAVKAPRTTARIFARKGYSYGVFRGFPTTFRIPILRSAKKVLLVRDPRDMLTSNYFSVRDSHRPLGSVITSDYTDQSVSGAAKLAKNSEIDDYVMKQSVGYKQSLAQYRRVCSKHEFKIYKYEAIIFSKITWLNDICNYYGWDVPAELIANVAAKQDVIPSDEQTAKHVRQVHPGDYKRKLRADTIARLTDYFVEDMRFFGYDDEEIFGSGKAEAVAVNRGPHEPRPWLRGAADFLLRSRHASNGISGK